jgi:hypothetical protein
LKTAGLVVGGFGIAGLAIGGVFGGLAAGKWSTAQSDCKTSATCTPSGNMMANSARSNALTLATVSTVGFIAGGVLTAGGLVVFLVAPKGSSESRASRAGGIEIAPAFGPGCGGLALRGAF